MSTLLDFLTDNPVDNLTEKVIISERLKEWPFTVKAMTGADFDKYQTQCTRRNKKGRTELNSEKLNKMVILNHTLDPDFSNAEAIAKAKCLTPEEFLYKSLLAGEISELAKKILSISGFDQEMEDLVGEVKNG